MLWEPETLTPTLTPSIPPPSPTRFRPFSNVLATLATHRVLIVWRTRSLLVKLLVMSNAANASPDSKEAVGDAAAGGGQQNEVTSVPDLVVTSDAGDDNAVIGCTDDDAKETETDADVEVVAAAADNKTADAAPNAEEKEGAELGRSFQSPINPLPSHPIYPSTNSAPLRTPRHLSLTRLPSPLPDAAPPTPSWMSSRR